MAITQGFLFAVSLYVAIASVMVFLSLVLNPTLDRWANIVDLAEAGGDTLKAANLPIDSPLVPVPATFDRIWAPFNRIRQPVLAGDPVHGHAMADQRRDRF